MKKILILILLSGCAATQTPRGQCFVAAGPWEVAQIGIEGAVRSPLVTPESKQTLKQVSQKGTEASRACVEAAKINDGDKVGFYAAMLLEATSMGRELAVQQLEVKP